ncbi:conserved hypothetical protein [Culex quinquefasciatus]|uniref:VTT domain-containing protein n=1 Tax=Culex quinquefasciatus TaxID=7176 RepID=B0WFQ6_CULQU|nr:conserved hypothetical protein [Culex quinquefasciatus]|eukprot:XP_001847540.1 conserved hypothetical protein [Culex quinquefasciatus]
MPYGGDYLGNLFWADIRVGDVRHNYSDDYSEPGESCELMLIKNETGRAILRVISGPRAFKIVLFARLTPIPFGLQNTIFGISAVNSRSYHTGTVIGLLPAQTINVYLGSKLRSIHEVLNDHHLGLAGYGVFVVEVIVGAALMVWVIQKARTELSAALLSDMDSDEKILIEIEA